MTPSDTDREQLPLDRDNHLHRGAGSALGINKTVTTEMVAPFGGITVGPATIGRDCNLSQGITNGVSGHGNKRGCPTIGDHVFLAAGANVFEKIAAVQYIKLGANAVIHPNIPNMAVVAMKPGFETLSMNGNQP